MELKSTDNTPSTSSSNVETASEAICGNLDIMERILGFLHECDEDKYNPKSPSDESKDDLFAACLVSKSFLDPALTILWRHLESLWPVLCLFPTFQEDDDTGDWSLTGMVRSEHLQRVLFYSRRIRSIQISSPLSTRMTDTLTIISSRMQHLQPFLPLTELIVQLTSDSTILDPMLFIMPLTLTNINIDRISPTTRVEAASLLQYLSSDHDSLKYLSLDGSLDDAFLDILLDCTSLRSLTLTSSETVFTAEYLEELTEALTSLESLSLKLLQSNEPVATGASFPPVVFPSLLDLTLTGDLTSISGILAVVKAPQLREIALSFSSLIELATPDAATFATCVAQVAKINGLEGKGNLRSVKISQNNMSTCIDLSAFDTLYALRTTIQVLHLQPKRLRLETTKEYKNPIETRLVYPNLVDLRISFQASLQPNGVYWTPIILKVLARACPKLKTLHISIHVGQEDHMKELDIDTFVDLPPHGLQTLVFHHLPVNWNFSISLAVALVRYFYYLFPMLSSVEYSQEGLLEGEKEWWKGVQDMLKMCQGKECARRRRLVDNV